MSDDIEAMVRKEVAAARAILREDKVLVSNGKIQAKLDKHFPDEPTEGDTNDGKPHPPPKKPAPATSGGEKKPGIWWGAVSNGE